MSLHRLLLAAAAAAIVACGDDGPVSPQVALITITPDSVVVGVSETATLTAAVLDQAGAAITGEPIIWTSNDLDVATVSPEGVVTGVSPGLALVQARARTIRGNARIVVTPGPVASIVLQPDSVTLDPGTERTFEAVVEDAFGNVIGGLDVTWSTTDPAVATVDQATGTVTAVAVGQTLLVFSAEGVADTAAVTVVPVAFAVVSAGGDNSCSVSNGSRVYCWGANSFGALGNGTSGGNQPTPQRVPGETEFAAVSAGGTHTCGLTRGGAAVCWGRNHRGQIGDNTTTSRTAPTFTAGNVFFSALDVGRSHTCGLATNNIPQCWGDNANGQLGRPIEGGGLGPPPPNPFPAPVQNSPTFAAISAGDNHGCALTGGGTAFCWGDGGSGALGDDTTAIRAEPVTVSGGHNFSSLGAGNDFSCGVDAAGAAFCWGAGSAGQLGTGNTQDQTAPTAVATGVTFTTVAGGGSHACALTAAGDAYCWGTGTSGQLGDGLSVSSNMPVQVTGGLAFVAITAGSSHSCAVTAADVAYCWGRNNQGQIGDGTTTNRPAPTRVSGQ